VEGILVDLSEFEPDRPRRAAKAAFAAAAAAAVLLIAFFTVSHQARNRIAEAADGAIRVAERQLGVRVAAGAPKGDVLRGFIIPGIRIRSEDDDAEIAAIDAIELRPALLSSLSGRLRLDRLVIVRPAINAVRNPAGEWNVAEIIRSLLGPPVQAYPEQPRINVRRIRIDGGVVSLRIERGRGKPYTAVFGRIAGYIKPRGPDRMLPADIDLRGGLERVRLHAAGSIRPGAAKALDIRWEAENILKGGAPSFFGSFEDTARRWRLNGNVTAKGRLEGHPLSPMVSAGLTIRDGRAFDLELGRGFARVMSENGTVRFGGNVGTAAARFGARGWIRTGKAPEADVRLSFYGLEAGGMSACIAPDEPEIVAGLLDGNAHLYGIGAAPEDLKLDADLTFRNGRLMYPTPAFSGQIGARAPVAFDMFTVTIEHERPKVTVKKARFSGSGVAASGKATFIYGKSLLDGRPAGPVWFDAEAQLTSPQILDAVSQNKYIGQFISGAATATARLSGRSDRPRLFTGAVMLALANGEIVSPYDPDALRFPADAKLSHVSFEQLIAELDVRGGAISAKNVRIRGAGVDADVFGFIGFDGSIKARVETKLKPDFFPMIADLRTEYKPPKDMKGVDRIRAAFEVAGTLQRPSLKWDLEEFKKNIAALNEDKKVESITQNALAAKYGKTKRRSAGRRSFRSRRR